MLDLIRALVSARLAFTLLVIGAVLATLAVWSLNRGAVGTGVAVLAAALACFAPVALVVGSHVRRR
jgi:hypothetical protein